MNAIFFKDNVYVLVKDKEPIDIDSIVNDKTLIGCYGTKANEKSLYGGRVNIRFSHTRGADCAYLYIDDIEIRLFENRTYGYNGYRSYPYLELVNELSLETCTAFLNQIESLGVDTFLENYKRTMLNLKTEQEKQIIALTERMGTENISSEDRRAIDYVLGKINLFLQQLCCIILILSIHLNAGLDNHIYTDTYNSIINQFFQ